MYYRGTQCSRLRRIRTKPVWLINWIQLHGPFSCVAGDAASYALRRFDKTAPGHVERGILGAGKEIQE